MAWPDEIFAVRSIEACMANIEREQSDHETLAAVNKGFIAFSNAKTISRDLVKSKKVADLFKVIQAKLSEVESGNRELSSDDEDDLIRWKNLLKQLCQTYNISLAESTSNKRRQEGSATDVPTTKSRRYNLRSNEGHGLRSTKVS